MSEMPPSLGFDQTASGLPVTGFSAMNQSARAAVIANRVLATMIISRYRYLFNTWFPPIFLSRAEVPPVRRSVMSSLSFDLARREHVGRRPCPSFNLRGDAFGPDGVLL